METPKDTNGIVGGTARRNTPGEWERRRRGGKKKKKTPWKD